MPKYKLLVTTKANGYASRGDVYVDVVEEESMERVESGIDALLRGPMAYKHTEESGAFTYIPGHNIDNIYVTEID